MPNSNRRAGFSRRSGTVTVIEEPVRRNAARTAKIAFWVIWIAVTALAATVLASIWHPIIALFAGAVIGAVTGLLAAAVIIAWPVLRALWWWAPEIVLAAGLVFGWLQLAEHTTLPFRLGAVALIAGVPAAIPLSGATSSPWPGASSSGTGSGAASPNSSSPTVTAASR
jgi:hypothetical protein